MLGRSFVIGVPARGPYLIENARLGLPPHAPGAVVIASVFARLSQRLAAVDIRPAVAGRVWSWGQGPCEAGLFVDLPHAGGLIAAKCDVLTDSVSLTVAKSSQGLRALVWLIVAGSVVAGIAGARFLGQESWDPEMAVLVGLLASIGLMVPSLYALTAWVAGRPGGPLLDQLDTEVRALFEDGPPPKKRKKRPT